MATFPENEVRVMRRYLPGSLPRTIGTIVAKLDSSIVESIPVRPGNEIARSINNARKAARKFFKTIAGDLETVEPLLDEAYKQLVHNSFERAEREVRKITPISLTDLSSARLRLAFRSRPTSYTRTVVIEGPDDTPIEPVDPFDPTGSGGPPRPRPKIRKPKTVVLTLQLAGYDGPRLNGTQQREIADFASFLRDGPEAQFRLPLLIAECRRGQADFAEAIRLYSGALENLTGSSEARRRFLAMRVASTHLAEGDVRYRQARTDQDRLREAVEHYAAARDVIQSQFGTASQDNPLVIEILQRAEQQLLKIETGLNYLGFRDAFVPPQSYKTLFAKASSDAGESAIVEQRFLSYLQQAEDMSAAKLELENNAKDARNRVDLARRRERQSTLRIGSIDHELNAVQEKLELLDLSRGLTHLLQASSGNFPGAVTTLLDFGARSLDLEHSRRALEFERRLALGEEAIAGLEVELAEAQVSFIQDALEFLTSGRKLNEELYYRLASILDRVRRDYLEQAIRFAYLAERALVFQMLQPCLDAPVIKFDYTSQDGELAGLRLKADVSRLEACRIDELEQSQTFNERYFLRQRYPAEFQRFLETGVLDFQMSLYDFEREHPGTWGVRVDEVQRVKLIGLTPPEGISGTLTHFGTFLVRDRDASLRSEVERLVPTDEQIDEAFEELESGDRSAVEVGGVILSALDPAILELSPDGEIPPEAEQETRRTFEGYAPNGLWRLELPKDVNDFDFSGIADIELGLSVTTRKPDLLLKQKVTGLLRDFEAELRRGEREDRIAVLSLREHFPSRLDSLSTGEAELGLTADLLPGHHADPNVKAVFLRALGEDDVGLEGIRLQLTKVGGAFTLDESTGSDGFTADLAADPFPVLDPADREPLLGTWRLRLTDPAQAGAIRDVLAFYMYELVS